MAIATNNPKRSLLAATLLLLGSTSIAGSQGAPNTAPDDRPAGSPGRFMMQPADGGVLRLDTATGNISFCRKSQDAWRCETLADERRALDDENKRLKSEIGDLKSAVERLEALLGVADAPKTKGAGVGSLPTEQDIDRASDYVRGMLKKLKEKIREFEDDAKEPAPKRT